MQGQDARRRVGDVAVAVKRKRVVERLRCRVLFGLEAGQHRPGEGEDPDQTDGPGQDAKADDDESLLADVELTAAFHARSSSLKRPERTRRAKVAMTIA